MKQLKEANSQIDSTSGYDIMTPEEVARYFGKSTSWAYKNWKILGGKKLGGSLFFPCKEDLYERLFGKRERLAVRPDPEREEIHGNLVQNQKGGQTGRSKKKGGDTQRDAGPEKTGERGDDPDRHGILGACE